MDWSELSNWDEYSKLLIGLIALTDPFGSLPLFISLTEKLPLKERIKTARTSIVVFVLTLIVFTYVGQYILNLFGITIAAFKIAGGIMFLFYALDMLDLIRLPAFLASDKSINYKTIGIVPIGIPTLAGPGTISKIIIMSSMHAGTTHKLLVNIVILSVGFLVYWLYRSTIALGPRVGKTGIMVLTKIMGVILAAIAVELILDGIVAHFPDLVSVH